MKFRIIFLCSLFSGMFPALSLAAEDWREVVLAKEISRIVANKSIAGWMVSGEMDVDSDGDLDMLVGHEYLLDRDFLGNETLSFLVYFNENGKYFHSIIEGKIFLSLSKVEHRVVPESKPRKAFVNYVSMPDGRRAVVAMWFEREGGLDSVRRKVSMPSIKALQGMDAENVLSASIDEYWSDHGARINQILENYHRLELEEARRLYGVKLPEESSAPESGKVGEDERASHAQEDDFFKGEMGKNKSSILALLIVLTSLGFVIAFVLYRRRRER